MIDVNTVDVITEDARLITHAHWVEGQTDNPNIHNILCSHCFNGYPSKGHANSQYVKEKFKWCPSCGAKMDENEYTLKYADEDTMMSATQNREDMAEKDENRR